MSIQDFVDRKKDLYIHLLQFIENEDDPDSDFKKLNKIIEDQKIRDNKIELKEFLHLLSKISNNHHRSPVFFARFERILTTLEKEIKQNFQNYDLFYIFRKNKRMILTLFQKKFIIPDLSIVRYMIQQKPNYYLYFFPEIKHFFNKENLKIIIKDLLQRDPRFFINFDLNRQNGENDTRICSLIRQDSVEEFIFFINKHNISISNYRIEPSIFETNPCFCESSPTLIEYASFYGSIQIFQYLDFNEVKLSQKCWYYGIHSKNPEFIYILETKEIGVRKIGIFLEAIECHHNDIAKYIYDNLMNEDEKKIDIESTEFKKCHKYSFENNINYFRYEYYNYLFIPKNFDNPVHFLYASLHDHINIVKLLLESKDWDFNVDAIFI